ncbi:hypothetical protein LUTEI9C_140035 [Luteimonas sp. 9C]|nr:hypothetical protein LUTEI9C_140035 [Luteimonas sp. 9C]
MQHLWRAQLRVKIFNIFNVL